MPGTSPAPSVHARVWTLLLASSVLYFFSINEADNDLWGHLLFGREIIAQGSIARVDTYSYTVAGQPWINHEWLSQVVLAATYQWGGSPGLLLLKFAVATLTLLLVFDRLRRRTQRPAVWGAVGLVTVAVLARGFAIRPQIFTYLGAALTLWLIDRHRRGHRGALWCFPPLFLVWVNLHGGFILGLGILGFFAAANLLRGREGAGQPWLALLGSIAVLVVNPYGPRLLPYVWNELSRTHPITEWQHATPTDAGLFAFFAMFVVLVATLPFVRQWREDGWESALAVGIGLMALRHQRHTPVFALCAAAPLAVQIEGARRWLRTRSTFALSPASQRVIMLALAAVALLQLALVGRRLSRDGLQIVFDPRDYPVAAVRALQHSSARLNLAVPLDWGEYVLWFLAPQVKVSLDGRFATVFPEQVVEDNFDFFNGAPAWRRLLDRYPTDAALLPVGSPSPIRNQPAWRRLYADAVAELYVRAERSADVHLNALSGIHVVGRFP